MTHTENLIMNELRKALENLEKTGVGYIACESTGEILYDVDKNTIRIRVDKITD